MSLTIERLNTKGEGVVAGHSPIARVLPGEVVEPDGRVIVPSTDRVKAPCRHYRSCGGCAMQHASDPFVAHWKTDVIREGLSARGIETTIRAITTSPPLSRRRATLHAKRTKSGAQIGFFARGSDILIETPDCQIVSPALRAGFGGLQDLAIFGGSRKGVVHFDVTETLNGLDVVVRGSKSLDAMQTAEAAAMARKFGWARLTWDDDPVAARLPARQEFFGIAVDPPAGAFLQATEHAQSALIGAVLESVGTATRVADLFAGCGTFALPLAKTVAVDAFEGADDLTVALDQAWRMASGLKHVSAQTRDLFRQPLLVDELDRYDAIVIDPPRAGAEAQSRIIAASAVPVVAAVSCNPVTFARDAEILITGGYGLDWVQPVDQFRWSSHVELVARFSKGHMAR